MSTSAESGPTVEICASSSQIMTSHRSITITVVGPDGEDVTGADLCRWAGLEPRRYLENFRRDLPVEVGGHGDRQLCVRNWDEAVAWLSERGIGADGWVHVRNARWVPAGSPSAPRRATPSRPCSKYDCGLPRSGSDDHPELCGKHANGARRSAANATARQAAWDAMLAEGAEEDRATRAAHDWAERLRSDFGLAVTVTDGRVALSGEGLHGLLTRVAAELGDLSDLMPIELHHREPR